MAKEQNRNMKRLKDEQQVRQRAGVIFGTNDEHGAAHGVEEVIANSVDEAREGYGDSIKVVIEDDGTVDVEDNGRGLPMDWNDDEKMYNWELALCTLYASGKYDSSQYGDSTGLNGLGLTATQYASEFMEVWSTYGGRTRYMRFAKGRPVGDMQVTAPVREGTGTRIRFKPDPEVFPALKNKKLPASHFINMFRQQAMLQDGLEFHFINNELANKEIKIRYKKGIVEFIEEIVQKSLLEKPVLYTSEVMGTDDPELFPEFYKLKMKIAFTFSRDTSFIELFHNGSHLFEVTGNKTLEALKQSFTIALTEYAKSINRLTRADKFIFKDIESILVCVASTNAPGNRTWFKNQTKGAINNPFIEQSFKQFVFNSLMNWLNNNKTQADKVITEAIANKTIREESEKISKKVINTLNKGVSFGNKPKDFVDCESKIVANREVYFVEGRSAKGATVTARDYKTQAVFPLRGKPINCLKEKLTRVLANDIIIDLFRILECGIEAKSEYIDNLPEFSLAKLNWDKLIICTDADVDGMHIRCLLITMFYVLAPSLLKAGKVYIAETPLYTIEWKKETMFAYSEDEKQSVIEYFIKAGAKESQLNIQRSKGLGENTAEMMKMSTMDPATRRLVKIEYPSDDSKVPTYFQALLGDDIETRRFFIDQYFDLTEVTD